MTRSVADSSDQKESLMRKKVKPAHAGILCCIAAVFIMAAGCSFAGTGSGDSENVKVEQSGNGERADTSRTEAEDRTETEGQMETEGQSGTEEQPEADVTGTAVLNTAGKDAPCISSPDSITVEDSTGTAPGSQIAVVAGDNSITVKSSSFTGYAYGRSAKGTDNAGIVIFQNGSEGAAQGCGIFSAEDSRFEIAPDSEYYATAPMFFVTNTYAAINLHATDLNFGSGILLHAAGNDGEWGEAGSNGAHVELNATNQRLAGAMTADGISTVTLSMTDSIFDGTVNPGDTAREFNITMDNESTWTLTGTSYITAFTNEDSDCSNIISNGNTVYYDVSNSANEWLEGKVIRLKGGGFMKPVR